MCINKGHKYLKPFDEVMGQGPQGQSVQALMVSLWLLPIWQLAAHKKEFEAEHGILHWFKILLTILKARWPNLLCHTSTEGTLEKTKLLLDRSEQAEFLLLLITERTLDSNELGCACLERKL